MVTLGVCLNLANVAAAQWSGLPFASLARTDGRVLAAGPDGLYELGGDTDAGAAIAARVALPETDFGQSGRSQVRRVDFGMTGGPLRLRLRDGDGRTREYVAREGGAGAGPRGVRVPVGSDGVSRYWAFEIENEGGADFTVDAVDIVLLARGVGR